jgi:hypothetical protein
MRRKVPNRRKTTQSEPRSARVSAPAMAATIRGFTGAKMAQVNPSKKDRLLAHLEIAGADAGSASCVGSARRQQDGRVARRDTQPADRDRRDPHQPRRVVATWPNDHGARRRLGAARPAGLEEREARLWQQRGSSKRIPSGWRQGPPSPALSSASKRSHCRQSGTRGGATPSRSSTQPLLSGFVMLGCPT